MGGLSSSVSSLEVGVLPVDVVSPKPTDSWTAQPLVSMHFSSRNCCWQYKLGSQGEDSASERTWLPTPALG